MSYRQRQSPIVWLSLLLLSSPLALRASDVPGATDAPTNTPPPPAAAETPAPAPPESTAPSNPAVVEPAMPPAAAPASAAPAAPMSPADRPPTYTVLSGDSYWTIGQKFGCTVKQIKKANNATKNTLKPGQVIKLPSAKPAATEKKAAAISAPPKKTAKKPATSTAAKTKTSLHPVPATATAGTTPHARLAQPVQDFDVPTSTFASCPVPPPPDNDTPVAIPVPGKAARVEPLVSDLEPTDASEAPVRSAAKATPLTPKAPALASESAPPALPLSTVPTAHTPGAVAPAPVSSKSFFSRLFHSDPRISTTSVDWRSRFLTAARNLGNRGVNYNASWRPPGENSSWAMDCSNTSRYLYKVTTGILLPRTASDQYYYLHLQQKAWDVPTVANGMADCDYLRKNLQPGDLLFWEYTYKPERTPPITHVMVFLGANEKGQWLMAGSQTGRGGEHNRPRGGPDVYVFDPTKPCGGYSTWLGMVHHKGRFCAYGRPLEADVAKLAVAANN